MIINYVYCQMPLGSNKQSSKFTVPSFPLVPINPKWVMLLSETASLQEQRPRWGCFWMHQDFPPVSITQDKPLPCECDPNKPLRLADAICLLGLYDLQELNYTSDL